MSKLMYTPTASLMNYFFEGFEEKVKVQHNIIERDTDFTLEIIAPGYKKHEFKISLESDYLVISVDKENIDEQNDLNYLRKSYSSRSFVKKFILAKNVDPDNIKANYEDGILYIEIPKAKDKLKKQIEVK